MDYNHKELEKKWQEKWQRDEIYKTEGKGNENEYILVEFAYPSGNLHVGHWYAFAVTDIYARYRRMIGKNVMFPVGFDAFGLPAENAAIKNKFNPRDWTYKNMEYMEQQLRSMGTMFDWDRKVATCDPDYYKWTQWLFIQLFNKGLVYQNENFVQWCPSCKTVLANEQVIAGKCERCGSEVEQRKMKEWKIKTTEYADRLIDGLSDLDWPEYVKEAQRNWIGRSKGTFFEFEVQGVEDKIKVFTTRADTLFGVTYITLAPENKLVEKWKDNISNWSEVEQYIKKTGNKTELERISDTKEKTGVKLEGVEAIHPTTGETIPIFISDYVIASYGTGAVMAVPAHDQRDFEFAQKFDLPITKVIRPHCVDLRNPHVDGKEIVEREAVMAVVYDPKKEKYLCLKWKKQNWHTFITGGIDDGEDPVGAAQREILEETGYKNVKFKRYLCGPTQSEFFAAHKNVNRVAFMHVLLFELENEEQAEISQEEQEIHEYHWIDRNEITKDMSHAEMDHILESLDKDQETAFAGEGIVFNSGEFDGLDSQKAIEKITKKYGQKTTNYKMRDWSVSRQRYWGCPIPLIHCEKCGVVPEREDNLPVELPELEDFTPRDDGKSPLAKAEDFVHTTCPKCGGKGHRESDTLDTFVDSSWYFLRYCDPNNTEEFAAKNNLQEWMPVDFYSGGSEHTTMHLLYARFFHKALFDLGLVHEEEPFTKRLNRGLILGPDGNKMSKSKGNVLDPDEIVERLGADTVRAYLAFIGPYNEPGSYPWDPNGVVGVRRFIERVIKLKESVTDTDSQAATKLLHKTIKGVGEDFQNLKFNTGLSKIMILANEFEKTEFSTESYQILLRLLAPIAPHITEELFDSQQSIHLEPWPRYDEELVIDCDVSIVIQVNGKVRGELKAKKDSSEDKIKKAALSEESIQKWLDGKEPKKVIVVPNKLINFVL